MEYVHYSGIGGIVEIRSGPYGVDFSGTAGMESKASLSAASEACGKHAAFQRDVISGILLREFRQNRLLIEVEEAVLIRADLMHVDVIETSVDEFLNRVQMRLRIIPADD